jgi:hypothetical protein
MPLVVCAFAPLFGLAALPWLVFGALLTMTRDGLQWVLLRGPKGALRALPFFLLRDLFVLGAWLTAPFRGHVSWRGNRVRVGAGTRLYSARQA